jgi:hypothetical protein
MKLNLSIGLATVLLAGLMTAGSAQAVGWPQPTTPCNEASQGTTATVEYRSRWHEHLEITYYCDSGYWQLSMVCDLNPGGICVVY